MTYHTSKYEIATWAFLILDSLSTNLKLPSLPCSSSPPSWVLGSRESWVPGKGPKQRINHSLIHSKSLQKNLSPARKEFYYLPPRRNTAPIPGLTSASLMSTLENSLAPVSQDRSGYSLPSSGRPRKYFYFLPRMPWLLKLKSRTLMPIIFLITLKIYFKSQTRVMTFVCFIHWVLPLPERCGSSSVRLTKEEKCAT